MTRALLGVLVLVAASGCVRAAPVDSDVEPVSTEVLRAAVVAADDADSTAPFAALLEVHPESFALRRAIQDHERARLEPAELIARYRAAAEASPDSGLAHYLLGRTLVAEPAAAEASFARAAELDPTNPWPVVGQAYLRASRGDLLGTIEVYEAGLERAPRSAMLRLFLGNQYLEWKLFIKAERELRYAHRLDPDDPEVWAALGKCLAMLSHEEQAMDLLLRAREARPEIAHIYPTLASLYLTRREVLAAEEAYRAGLSYGMPRDEGLSSQIRAAKLVQEL